MTLRFHLTPVRMAKSKTKQKQFMMMRMWSRGTTLPLLMGVQTCTVTAEINMVVSQKTENQSTSRPSYTTLGHIPKGCTFIPEDTF